MEEEKLRGGIRFVAKIPRNDLGKVVRPPTGARAVIEV